MSLGKSTTLLAIVVSSIVSEICAAADKPRPLVFRTNRDLVITPATVVDRQDKLITDLEAQDFVVWEEGKRQTVVDVSLGLAPVSLGIVMDVSGSMAKALGEVRAAVRDILQTVQPDDEILLLTFRDRPSVAVEFCREPERIQEAAAKEAGVGGTALWDALMLGFQEIRRASNQRRAILLFSDGGDRDSRYSWKEVRDVAREADVRVYPFLLPAWSDDKRFDVNRLCEIADESGGRCFEVTRPEDFRDSVEKLEIHWQYTIEYSPAERGEAGKFRRVKVELAGRARKDKLRVFWRRGYLAPDLMAGAQ